MARTINLSRARSFSRRRRAQKAMSILREKLEEQEGEKVSVSPEINSRIWENGVERPPGRLEVEVIETESGLRAVLPEKDEEVGEHSGSGNQEDEQDESLEEDYEDIVSGTVAEAKEAIEELESPDYEAILEAEKEGKDRKTLKQFIESKM